ncbi:MAG: 23S rRNA (guanosine(2251)-2'-O)-methyltransferase RlmB [Anaerolineales bacterium]|nr:23S rRNA (guanosine(2251)-2'-O)-methyltransferase RlmB [Anaerolineales bacterium]
MNEWIIGRNPVYEVLRAGRRRVSRLMVSQGAQEKGRLAEIIRICKTRDIRLEYASRKQLDALGDGHQGAALEASEYVYCDLQDILDRAAQRSERPFILILDVLQDPQNLGTLLRTAEIVGVHGVLLPFRRTATVTPAVVSASSGASEHLLIAQVNLAQAIERLKEADIWVVGLEGGLEAQLPEGVRLDSPIALVVGNEAEGMRPLVRNSCDLLLRLPMRGQIGSLNAAVAGSIALYLAWQARGFESSRP